MSAGAIHQLVHTLTWGDAISGEVLALQQVLREAGRPSEIYAINVDPRFKAGAHDYRTLDGGFGGEVILHYSLGSPLNGLYAKLRAASRTLIYHNLTPARWFCGVNPRIVADIEKGLQELPGLCALSSRLIADSGFNAGELQALGFKAGVLELPIDPARWSVAANPGVLSLLRNDPALHMLHVGRLAPNKCLEDIVRIFHFLHQYINPESRLWMAGLDIDTELYSFSLKRLVRELDLMDVVHFTGRMADSEVRALYQGASVYVCMSEHEGFCLPVVEAMHFGLPVVAFASSALPETVKDGGVLVSEKRHAEIAELIQEIYANVELRDKLVAAGRRRVAALSFEGFKENVLRIFI